MISAHDVDAVRRAEDEVAAGLAAELAGELDGGLDALMARAARAVAGVVIGRLQHRAVGRRVRRGGLYGRRAVLLVGAGSNGGDALHAGVYLARRGVAVSAVLAARRAHPGGLAAAREAGVRILEVGADVRAVQAAAPVVAAADVVLDGLLGTGSRPGLDPASAALVAAVPPGALVVAVDLPSGIAAEGGQVSGPHVVADVTVAIGTAKPSLLLPPAVVAAGEVVVVDIGLGPALGPARVEQLDAPAAAARWPVPGREADKYSRGVLGVVAGGSTYTGAAVLCVGGAVHAGAGMVRYVGPGHPTELVRARYPEVVPGPGRVQAWAAGSGTDPDDPELPERLRPVWAQAVAGTPTLLDAGALAGPGGLAARVDEHGPFDPNLTTLLLTPHAGELARLLTDLGHVTSRGDVTDRPLASASTAAQLTGACVLLKGATTLVVAPDGRPVRAQSDGPGWLGTAGAGDVLAGIAGTLLAAGLHPLDAGSLAAAVHGRAAALVSGGGPLRALAVAEAVPRVVAHLLEHDAWPSGGPR